MTHIQSPTDATPSEESRMAGAVVFIDSVAWAFRLCALWIVLSYADGWVRALIAAQ